MLFTPTVVKNLLKKPATRKYPFEVRDPFPKYRGELVIEMEKCIFCGTCERKCPSQCITVDRDAGTWQCDPQACIYCGYCVDACPTKSLYMKDTYRKPSTEPVTWIEHGTPPRHKRKDTPRDVVPARETDPVLDEAKAAAPAPETPAPETPAPEVEAAQAPVETAAAPTPEAKKAQAPAEPADASAKDAPRKGGKKGGK